MPIKKRDRDQVAAEAAGRDFKAAEPAGDLHPVTIRLTDRQYKRVAALAAENGIALAAMARVLLTKALE